MAVQSVRLADNYDDKKIRDTRVAGVGPGTLVTYLPTGEITAYPSDVSMIDYASDQSSTPPGTQTPEIPPGFDVDGDGFVTPLDALALINYVNSQIDLFNQRVAEGENINAMDVNRDGSISPLDVLAIINYINSISSSTWGEGESVVDSTDKIFTEVSSTPVPY